MIAEDSTIDSNKQKSTLRKEAKSALEEIFQDSEKVQKRTKLAIQKIKALKEFRKARIIAIYYPTANEIDLKELFEEKFKTWLLPKALGNSIMTFFEVENFDHLIPGRYGVMEPHSSSRFVKKSAIDLVITPALAYDKNKYRLGRGGGYYDKLLGELPEETTTIGICFKELVQEDLAFEEHDKAVDILIEV